MKIRRKEVMAMNRKKVNKKERREGRVEMKN